MNLKNDEFLSFIVNQEKQLDNISKNLGTSNNISEETTGTLKEDGTGQGIMYELCKIYKDIVNNYPPFSSILSAINTPTYK